MSLEELYYKPPRRQRLHVNRPFNPTYQRVEGPFATCKNCPYPSHGFLCYSKDGTCLRTVLKAMKSKQKE